MIRIIINRATVVIATRTKKIHFKTRDIKKRKVAKEPTTTKRANERNETGGFLREKEKSYNTNFVAIDDDCLRHKCVCVCGRE